MTKTIDFLFDFASPNGYLAHKVMPQISARCGARVKIMPVLLGGLFKLTGNQAPMTAFGAVRGKLAYEALEMRRFIAAHGLVAFRMNPHFPINSLMAMRGLVAAEMIGVEGPYLEAVAAGFWELELKMDDPEVLAGVLAQAGLDGGRLVAMGQDPQVKGRLVAATERAAERGAFGVPTFFVGEEMFFGKERLGQVEAEACARVV
jgi:2-hydroxychromene-2-carboxylate isomerase